MKSNILKLKSLIFIVRTDGQKGFKMQSVQPGRNTYELPFSSGETVFTISAGRVVPCETNSYVKNGDTVYLTMEENSIIHEVPLECIKDKVFGSYDEAMEKLRRKQMVRWN